MEWIANPEARVTLATLTLIEIVLGIDNIIFISTLVGRLPTRLRERARRIGIGLAMLTRIGLLLVITWVMRFQADLFAVFDHGVSGRDLILFFGGLFLMAEGTLEIHHCSKRVLPYSVLNNITPHFSGNVVAYGTPGERSSNTSNEKRHQPYTESCDGY